LSLLLPLINESNREKGKTLENNPETVRLSASPRGKEPCSGPHVWHQKSGEIIIQASLPVSDLKVPY
jgi:hypothetical protein